MSAPGLSLARVKVKMGNLWARFRHKDVRIILLGLDSAGKTTILYRLKLDDLVTTIPTIGFNVESIQYKDLHLTAWDIGSRDKIRPLFRHYYKGADAVVFVIDSHDPERLDELNYDVIKPAVNAEELTSAVFLFLANKIDLPDTMSVEEIAERLGLKYLKHPWGIIPVSAVSGEGLQDALQWLAIRLGSAQVKPRNFAAAQPQPKPKSIKECRTQSSLSSASSTTTSRTDNSRPGSKGPNPGPQKPIIFVNSKLYMDTRTAQSTSLGSVDNTPSPLSVPHSAVSTPTSSYRYGAYTPRKTPGSVMNSFSSYSIAQSMREDMSRRKFSAISNSDIRKLSCASLSDSPGARKLSAASLLDCPSARKMSSVSLMESPYRRKMSTSFVIDPPNYRKFSSVSLMDTPSGRKLSVASLGDPRLTDTPYAKTREAGDHADRGRKFSAASLADQNGMDTQYGRKLSLASINDSKDDSEKPKMSYLSAAPTSVSTPPTAKRRSEDLSLQGFGSFTPIMADYIHNDRKDSETSADSLNIVSPSEHIQPHLRPLGLKKSPFLSGSANKYVVNSIEAEKETHYEEMLRLLPERYTNLNAFRESYLGANNHLGQNQNVLSALDQTNGNTTDVPNQNQIMSGRSWLSKKVHKPSRQQSQDSDSSNSSGNGKRSNLDLFCTPSRRWNVQSRRARSQSREKDMAVMPSSVRGAYCSRAYSAIKCLFFRPTKEEMRQETNSISSEEGNDNNAEKKREQSFLAEDNKNSNRKNNCNDVNKAVSKFEEFESCEINLEEA